MGGFDSEECFVELIHVDVVVNCLGAVTTDYPIVC